MFFELSRACEVEGGMAPDGIIEPVDVAANGLVGLLAGVEDGPPDELGFQGLEERLDHGVVIGVGAQISCWAWVGGSYHCLSGDALRYRHAEPGIRLSAEQATRASVFWLGR